MMPNKLALKFHQFDVLAVASDPAGPSALAGATVTIETAPLHGTATVDPNTQQITYVPDSAFSGVDGFTYTITDANGATSQVATLTVDVLAPPPGIVHP